MQEFLAMAAAMAILAFAGGLGDSPSILPTVADETRITDF